MICDGCQAVALSVSAAPGRLITFPGLLPHALQIPLLETVDQATSAVLA